MLRKGAGNPARPAGALPGKRHLCFVAPHAWPVLARDASLRMVGGAEVQQCILARLLVRQGWRVSMISLDFGQPQRAEIDGVEVFRTYGAKRGLPILRFIHPRLTSTWRALREAGADVYYVRSASMLAAVVDEFCRRHGRRSIYAGASDADFDPASRQIRLARDRWLYRRGLARVDRVVVQNRVQLEACRAHYGRNAVLIPSCYELPADSRPATGDRVLWVGTVHEGKRPELLLEIARRLPHRRFVLVGGEPYGETLRRSGYFEAIRSRAAALANVEMTGFLPLAEAERRFDTARVLVNTSVYEGMPNTFLQAWARGIPTVATVDSGAPVTTVFQDPDSAVREIEQLFLDEHHRQASSRRSREHFERNHSSAAVMAKYLRLLEELVQ